MLTFLLRNLELIFTAAGLLVILGITQLVHPAGFNSWEVAAITSILVGVIHGVLFWVVRQRQRLVRRHALEDAKRMLRDIIINQLAIIRIDAELQNLAAKSDTVAAFKRLEAAVDIIDEALNNISEESLARWRSRYDVPTPPFAE